jgi:hypothetical protein
VRKLLRIVQERIPKRFGFDRIGDIQVLCPMNRNGLGARSLNIEPSEGAEPARGGPHRTLRLDLLPGRQGHAGRERLRQGRLQRRSRRRIAYRTSRKASSSPSSMAGKSRSALANLISWFSLTPRRSTKAKARIPRRRDPAQHSALPNAAAEPGLHGSNAWETPRGAGRAEEGSRDRR